MQEQLQAGVNLEDIETLGFLSLNPLPAQWLVNVYTYFTRNKGKGVIAKGWKRAESYGLLDSVLITCIHLRLLRR